MENQVFKVGDIVISENRGTARVKTVHKNGSYTFMMLDGNKELGIYKVSKNVAETYWKVRIPSKLERALQ